MLTIREALAGKEPFEIREDGVFVSMPDSLIAYLEGEGRLVDVTDMQRYHADRAAGRCYPVLGFKAQYRTHDRHLRTKEFGPDQLDDALPEGTTSFQGEYENGSFGFCFWFDELAR